MASEGVKAALALIQQADDWADEAAYDKHVNDEMRIVAELGRICARLDALIAMQAADRVNARPHPDPLPPGFPPDLVGEAP
jgi:hypothetical protein